MKTLFTIIALTLSTAVFANTDGQTSDKEKASVKRSVEQVVAKPEVISALGVEGSADVTITVDATGAVHVAAVQTNDYLLEYHIRKSIEGAKMIVEDSLVGKTINFIVDVVQSK